jgi:hypothetical protein
MEYKHNDLLLDDHPDLEWSGSQAHDSSECRHGVVKSSRCAVLSHVHEGSVSHNANNTFEGVWLGCVGLESSPGGSACRKEDSKAFSASLG